MSTSNKPLDTLRLPGGIKATIWKNTTQAGRDFHSVEISRTYKTEDGYRDSHSFSPNELLIVGRLAERADDRITELNSEQGNGCDRTFDVFEFHDRLDVEAIMCESGRGVATRTVVC